MKGERRALILSFIRDFVSENGYSPSVREIAEGVGLSSTSTVQTHLENLERDGAIKRSKASRAITLTSDRPAVKVLKERNNVPTVLSYQGREYVLRAPAQ